MTLRVEYGIPYFLKKVSGWWSLFVMRLRERVVGCMGTWRRGDVGTWRRGDGDVGACTVFRTISGTIESNVLREDGCF